MSGGLPQYKAASGVYFPKGLDRSKILYTPFPCNDIRRRIIPPQKRIQATYRRSGRSATHLYSIMQRTNAIMAFDCSNCEHTKAIHKRPPNCAISFCISLKASFGRSSPSKPDRCRYCLGALHTQVYYNKP